MPKMLNGVHVHRFPSDAVARDSLRHVDVIIVPAWAGDAGAVEASDLVRRGFATTVAVVPEQVDPADQVLVAKGIMQAGGDSWPTRLIRSLGVPRVTEIPWSASGTQSEGLLVVRRVRDVEDEAINCHQPT